MDEIIPRTPVNNYKKADKFSISATKTQAVFLYIP